MFEQLSEVLTKLEKAGGAKAKEALLWEYLTGTGNHDEVVLAGHIRWMLKAALDQGVSYGIDQLPPKVIVEVDESVDQAVIDKQLVDAVAELGVGRGVTDEYLEGLVSLMSTSEARYKVMSRILRKDLRCGIQAKTVNKVSPGTVFRVPYQRCSGYDRINKMTWPALLQRKANGMFTYLFPGGTFVTRKGMRFTIPDSTLPALHESSGVVNKQILIGELVVLEEDMKTPLPRAVSNGIINSFIAGEGQGEFAGRVKMFCWGSVTEAEFAAESSNRPYFTIFNAIVAEYGPDELLAPIEHWKVESLEAAQGIFKSLIAKGEEGCIVKSLDTKFFWKDQSSCDFQIKMKAQAEAEFLITGIYPGESGKKYEGKLGGVSIKSGDGLIVCDCGGGHYLTDAIRNLPMSYLEDKLVGQIGTFKFYGITENRDKPGTFALDHPQFSDLRTYEKVGADTLEYCRRLLKGGDK